MLGLAIALGASAASLVIGVLGSPMLAYLVMLAGAIAAIAVEQTYTIYGQEGAHLTPYMTRLVIGRLRLHIFWRGDEDPDPHDHPWGFWTFPLVTYEEEVTMTPDESQGMCDFLGIDPGTFVYRRIVERFRFHYRPATHTHRVIGAVQEIVGKDIPIRAWEPTGKPIVTIVWTERVSRQWGFLVACEGFFRWTPWKKYVFGGGKTAACAPKSGVTTDE